MNRRAHIVPFLLAAALYGLGITVASADAGTFRLVGLNVAVQEAAGAIARVAVIRDGGASLPAASVTFATVDDSAFADIDYSSVSNRLTFDTGVTTNIVEIPILDNAFLHTYSTATVAPRTFFVRLSEPSSGASLGMPAALAVSILDDEVPPRSWFVRPATGGWSDSDVADLRALLTVGDTLPALDEFTETTFEDADPTALFCSASSCVFLDFGPREASYAAAFLVPWRNAIEAWVRSGGRLFVNAAPQSGTCPLPFGLTIEASVPEEDFRRQVNYYRERDALCWIPTPLNPDLAVYYAIAPANPSSNVSPASVVLPDADDLPEDATAWFGHSEGTTLGARDGVSYEGPFLLVDVGAGSVAYASLRPPAHLAAGEIGNDEAELVDGTSFWQRMVHWSFRIDGFGLVATEDWAPDGVVGEANSFAPPAKTYGVYNLSTSAVEVTVSSDVAWLVAESDRAVLPAGHLVSVGVSLAPEALAFPVGSYTGTVTFVSSRPFYENANTGAGSETAYPAPEFRRIVILTVLPPSGTLAPITTTSVALPKAHPGAMGATDVVATLTNLSNEHPVRIFGCSLSGDNAAFQILSPTSFPAEIPAGESLQVLVAFTPAGTGLHRATLILETSDRDHPAVTLSLSSRGVPLELETPILWEGGRGCELMWSSVLDAIYEVMSTDDLTQPFERIGRTVGENGMTTFFDTREHGAARFYRIRQHISTP